LLVLRYPAHGLIGPTLPSPWADRSHPLSAVLYSDSSQTLLEESPFRLRALAGEGRGEAVGGAITITAFERQIADGRVQEIVAGPRGTAGGGVACRRARTRTAQPRPRDGAVQRDDRRRLDRNQRIVQFDDVRPVRLFVARRNGMARGDASFEVIPRQRLTRR